MSSEVSRPNNLICAENQRIVSKKMGHPVPNTLACQIMNIYMLTNKGGIYPAKKSNMFLKMP